ncbi:MAG: VWA domain-containing protein [Microscillaceae bacterium]
MSTLKTYFSAENRYWWAGSPKTDFFVYFELEAIQFSPQKERIPLNVSLVIDRSGSMVGDKLKYAKKALDFVIDNLHKEDYLSIVQYDNEVEVVSASAAVAQKATLHALVAQIAARGATNLSGGMLEGFQQVQSTQKPGYVNRVLLLSDGLANEGVTDPTRLQQMVQKKFREQGIALSTFGVGADFNEDLMTHLSEYGGGNYYFIDSPDKIPAIFASELSGLLSVVAQNARLKVQFPEKALRCAQVYGYPADIKADSVLIPFNDVFSEEKKAVLLRFEVLSASPETPWKITADLGYDDVIERLERIRQTFELDIVTIHDEALFAKSYQAKVQEEVVIFVGNAMLENAIQKADNRDLEAARQIVQQAKVYLDAFFQHHPASEALKKLYQNLLDYEAKLAQMKDMSQTEYQVAQKMSKFSSYSARRKK